MRGYIITVHLAGGSGLKLYLVRAFTGEGAKDKLSRQIGAYSMLTCSVKELDRKPVELIFEHDNPNYEG